MPSLRDDIIRAFTVFTLGLIVHVLLVYVLHVGRLFDTGILWGLAAGAIAYATWKRVRAYPVRRRS